MTLATFLSAHKREPKSKDAQTHTWFAAGPRYDRTCTLHIPLTDVPELRQLLVSSASKGKTTENPRSITEKLAKGHPFPLIVDLDFKPADIKEWAEANGYQGEVLHSKLVEKLQDIVTLYHVVVAEVMKTSPVAVRMIIATRLLYKIHLHFPGVIVDAKRATALAKAFDERFAAAHGDIYNDKVTDTSVYATGLRMLYCHKGSMMDAEKRNDELEQHEELFGAGTFSDAYYVTDLETWTQKLTPSIRDLEDTSLLVGDEVPLTKLHIPSSSKDKKKDLTKVTNGTKSTSARKDTPSGSTIEIELVNFLAEAFSIPLDDIRLEKKAMEGDKFIVPTRCRDCPFAAKKHRGNQLYFVLTATNAELRCHDGSCQGKPKIIRDLPESIKLMASKLSIPQNEVQLRERRQELMAKSFQTIRELHPEIDIAEEDLTALDEETDIAGMQGFVRALSRNRWCPVCKKKHDSPENCILTTIGAQQLVCKKTLKGSIRLPFDKETSQLVFNIQVVNNNVINHYGPESALKGPRDFGQLDDFPTLFDDPETNRLCYESIVTGATYQVSTFVARIVREKYVYVDCRWYKFLGTHWTTSNGPDSFFATEVADIYQRLMHTYRDETQTKWLQLLVSDISNKSRRKQFIEELEGILQESGEVPVKLDSIPTLFSFKNGVYDSVTCAFREHRPEDYTTTLLPYDFPTESNPKIRQEILGFFEEVMPNPDTRRFLLTYLALHLEGRNRHQIAVILTGVGGNGKSIVKHLMKTVFQHLQSEPVARFLTEERPSDEKPSPNVADLERKSCLFVSEPEHGKKINGAFLKFLSGNDLVRCRLCHSNKMVEFMPRFIPTLLCNTVPLIDCGAAESRSLWRRVRIVHFPMQYLEENETICRPNQRRANTGLVKHIEENWGPEMMLYLTEIFAEYVANDHKLHVPTEVIEAIQEQQQENNRFGSWLKENLVEEPGAKLHVHRIVEVYNSTGPEVPIPARMGASVLKANGFTIAASNRLDGCTLDCITKRSKGPIIEGFQCSFDD